MSPLGNRCLCLVLIGCSTLYSADRIPITKCINLLVFFTDNIESIQYISIGFEQQLKGSYETVSYLHANLRITFTCAASVTLRNGNKKLHPQVPLCSLLHHCWQQNVTIILDETKGLVFAPAMYKKAWLLSIFCRWRKTIFVTPGIEQKRGLNSM